MIVREGLAIGRNLGNNFQKHDTSVERALKFQRDVNQLLSQYEEVYEDMISNFFTSKSHGSSNSMEKESNEIVWSNDESDIVQISKKGVLLKVTAIKFELKYNVKSYLSQSA